MKKSVLAIAAIAASLTLHPASAETAAGATTGAGQNSPETAPGVTPEALAEAQETYATVCAACHGRTGRGMASFPRLSGNTVEYLTDRLVTYRAGEQVGPNSMLMIPNAADLSDAQLMALAVFMAETFP